MKSESGLAGLLRRRLPILEWGAEYSGQTLVGDLVAAAIVSMMLIPQSLAYALLVGLPPQLGLYASMAPLLLYAIFGTSRALAVGPVAVASLMTGAAAAQIATQGTPEHLGAAVAIALLTGVMMVAMGFLRLGFLANFLSHPVVSGFITAAAVQIAAGQIGPLLGIKTHGESLLEILESLLPHLGDVKPVTAAVGIATVVFLLWAKRGLKPLMVRFGLGDRPADIVAKAAPAMAIVACTAAVGIRVSTRAASASSAKCRPACRSWRCRRSTRRSGRRCWCPRCSSRSSATWSRSRSRSRWLPSVASASTRTRNSSRSAWPTSARPSPVAFPSPARCRVRS